MKITDLNLLAIILLFKNTKIFCANIEYTGVSNRTMPSPFSTRFTPSDISCGIICLDVVACFAFSFVKASGTCKLYDIHPANSSAVVTASAGEDLFALMCESGWILHDDSCYLFSLNVLSWEASKIYCESVNSHLLKVETDVEHQFIRQRLTSTYNTSLFFWIGARSSSSLIGYHWTDGSPVSFDGWAVGLPGTSTGCVDYLKSYGWLWNSHGDCVGTNIPFICEKPKWQF